MELLERDEHLARLEVLLKQTAAGEGRVVLVEGEAGIGKTALARAADRLALDHGFTVLRARGAELERDFPHGVVRQLFEPLVRRATEELRQQVFRGAAALAAPVVGLGEEAPERLDAGFAVNHGLYWLTVELSDLAPLCLVVDDVHWSDAASLAFLDYLAQRVHELPVLLLATVRTGDPGSDQPLLQALREVGVAERMLPDPLSTVAIGGLIQAHTSKQAEPGLVDAFQEATRGNPFFIEELLRALRAQGMDPTEDSVRNLGPTSIARAVLGRIARMLPEALMVARAVAVLDVDATSGHVTAVAGLDGATTTVAADALVAAGVLEAGSRLRFLHPILRRAVYEDIPPLCRADLHHRAAHALEQCDPDRAAVHLLPTHPAGDASVVERLAAAAQRAMSRGAPGAASALLRRAREEPPAPDALPGVLAGLGRAALGAGEPDAIGLLQSALDYATDTDMIVSIVETLSGAMALVGNFPAGLELLTTWIDKVDPTDRDARLRLEAAFDMLSVFLDVAAVPAAERIERLLPSLTGGTPYERVLLAGASYHRAVRMAVPADAFVELAARADAIRIINEQPAGSPCWAGVADPLLWCDHPELSLPIIEEVFDHARRTGSGITLILGWVIRSRWAHLRGDLIETTECAQLAATSGPGAGPMGLPYLASVIVLSLLDQGRSGDAHQVLEAWGLRTIEMPDITTGRCLLLARAHLNAAMRRHDEAAADAREAVRRSHLRGGSLLSTGFLYGNTAALLAAGLTQEAASEAHRELALAETFRTNSSLGCAYLGLALSGEGDRLELLRQSVELLGETPRRLDHARAMLEYGAALRRANRRTEARDVLTRAAELAHQCTATGLVERARTELVATGARPRRLTVTGVDALTPSERRVATMAAEGLTNTEIAQALFVTRKTVEKHLAGAFQKLGVSSRACLGAALGDPTGDRRP